MRGNNTITLNQATVVLALQHYFDEHLFATGKAPRVKSVKQDSSPRGYGPETFAVETESSETPTTTEA